MKISCVGARSLACGGARTRACGIEVHAVIAVFANETETTTASSSAPPPGPTPPRDSVTGQLGHSPRCRACRVDGVGWVGVNL